MSTTTPTRRLKKESVRRAAHGRRNKNEDTAMRTSMVKGRSRRRPLRPMPRAMHARGIGRKNVRRQTLSSEPCAKHTAA